MLKNFPEITMRDARDIVSRLWYRADGSRAFGSCSVAPAVIVTTARDWFAMNDSAAAAAMAASR
ncbi:hypothetical protein AB4851_01380 [Burkholderia sp. 22PA0099]|uniref:hypothetical protein n=1 Tax=Burkholderia sp. 22PA0099 TaxID=3237372 RepID=UPI0039C19B1B